MADFRNTIKSVVNLSPVKLQQSNKDKQQAPYYGRKAAKRALKQAETQVQPGQGERRSGADRRHQQGQRGPWLESRASDRRRRVGFETKV